MSRNLNTDDQHNPTWFDTLIRKPLTDRRQHLSSNSHRFTHTFWKRVSTGHVVQRSYPMWQGNRKSRRRSGDFYFLLGWWNRHRSQRGDTKEAHRRHRGPTWSSAAVVANMERSWGQSTDHPVENSLAPQVRRLPWHFVVIGVNTNRRTIKPVGSEKDSSSQTVNRPVTENTHTHTHGLTRGCRKLKLVHIGVNCTLGLHQFHCNGMENDWRDATAHCWNVNVLQDDVWTYRDDIIILL